MDYLSVRSKKVRTFTKVGRAMHPGLTNTSPVTGGHRHGVGLLSAVYWVVVGALAAVGIGGILTIGPPLIMFAVLLGCAGAAMPATRNRSAGLVVAGLSGGPFLIAWLNRDGPGEICRVVGDGSECIEEWSPWPFAAVGVALVVTGVCLAARRPAPGLSPPFASAEP
jgi:hypothetical protein